MSAPRGSITWYVDKCSSQYFGMQGRKGEEGARETTKFESDNAASLKHARWSPLGPSVRRAGNIPYTLYRCLMNTLALLKGPSPLL